MKLLVELQSLIIHVKVPMINYCFVRVSDYMFVFVMIFVSRFGGCSVRNAVAGFVFVFVLKYRKAIYLYLIWLSCI